MRRACDETARIRESLIKAFNGGAWHGPSLSFALRGVSAETAATRPVTGNTHTIWQIVLHVEGWLGVVAKRARGQRTRRPAQGDWPPIKDRSETAWRQAREALKTAHSDLLTAIGGIDDSALNLRIGSRTVRENLIGTLEHMAYHAGQISLLKRIVRNSTRS